MIGTNLEYELTQNRKLIGEKIFKVAKRKRLKRIFFKMRCNAYKSINCNNEVLYGVHLNQLEREAV